MHESDILRRAIDKAISRGYKPPDKYLNNPDIFCAFLTLRPSHTFHIIFDHNFAKAIWGDKDMWYETECNCTGADFHFAGHDSHLLSCKRAKAERGHLFHLQQMVICEDPFDYLEKFIG